MKICEKALDAATEAYVDQHSSRIKQPRDRMKLALAAYEKVKINQTSGEL